MTPRTITGGKVMVRAVDRPPQALREIYPAVFAEGRHWVSGPGIKRDHLRERREDHQTLVVTVAPIGEAAIQPTKVGGISETILVDFRIVSHLVSPVAELMAATCDSEVLVYSVPPTISGVIRWRNWGLPPDWRP
jgi:hypothetical protein